MRMWLVDPKIMCRNHLLGEHLELHILASKVNAGEKIKGFIEHGLVDPCLAAERHGALVKEMQRRGYKHASPLVEITGEKVKGCVDPEKNIRVLAERCEECKKRIEKNTKH